MNVFAQHLSKQGLFVQRAISRQTQVRFANQPTEHQGIGLGDTPVAPPTLEGGAFHRCHHNGILYPNHGAAFRLIPPPGRFGNHRKRPPRGISARLPCGIGRQSHPGIAVCSRRPAHLLSDQSGRARRFTTLDLTGKDPLNGVAGTVNGRLFITHFGKDHGRQSRIISFSRVGPIVFPVAMIVMRYDKHFQIPLLASSGGFDIFSFARLLPQSPERPDIPGTSPRLARRARLGRPRCGHTANRHPGSGFSTAIARLRR